MLYKQEPLSISDDEVLKISELNQSSWAHLQIERLDWTGPIDAEGMDMSQVQNKGVYRVNSTQLLFTKRSAQQAR